jgi:hypothetical protein
MIGDKRFGLISILLNMTFYHRLIFEVRMEGKDRKIVLVAQWTWLLSIFKK